MPLSLYLLAVAVFAMGTSEFMLAGLAPDLAASLDVSIGAAGLLTSAFAVGMIIGAPTMAALARRWPPRTSLLGFVTVFAVAVLPFTPVYVTSRVRVPLSLSFVTAALRVADSPSAFVYVELRA